VEELYKLKRVGHPREFEHMRRLLLATVFAAASTAAPGQPPMVAIELSNFRFSPNAIQLRAGVPTVLRLHNASNGGHNFSAPEFFAAARLDPRTAAAVGGGTIEIPGRGVVTMTVVPTRGRYRLKCTHTLHSAFGMKGTIVVN
jgi:plastocyanin